MHDHPKRCRWVLAVILWLWMATSMAIPGSGASPSEPDASDAAPMAHVGELPDDGPYAQFIVKYRAGSEPARNTATAQARIAATAERTGLDGTGTVELHWLRRLAVEADVFRTARPLDSHEAASLMQAFAADPQVEYIEVDGIMTTQRPTTGIR